MEVARETAKSLLLELGNKSAANLTDSRLIARLQKLPDTLDDESADQVESPDAVKLLKAIQKDPSILEDVEIVDAETNGHSKDKKAGKKAGKKNKEEPEDEVDEEEVDEVDEDEDEEDEDEEEDAADDEEGDEEEAPAKAKKGGKKEKTGKKDKGKKASNRQGMSCIDAAAKVLAEKKKPLNCKEMIDAMTNKGYWTSPGGATPHATLASAILREISTKGKSSRFHKTSPGHFAAPGVKAKK